MSQYINGQEFDEWQGELKQACMGVVRSEHERCSAYFTLGDTYLAGEKKFGEEVAQGLPEGLPMVKKTIQNAAFVAKRVTPENRNFALPWTHFREVAALPPPAQKEHLEAASEQNLSSRALQKRIKGDSPRGEDEAFNPPGQKVPRLEIPKWLAAVRQMDCLLDTPFCKGGKSMACHSNWQEDGKGKGVKAHDIFTVPGCAECHRWLDESGDSKDVKRDVFHRALKKTIKRLWDDGVIGIIG